MHHVSETNESLFPIKDFARRFVESLCLNQLFVFISDKFPRADREITFTNFYFAYENNLRFREAHIVVV